MRVCLFLAVAVAVLFYRQPHEKSFERKGRLPLESAVDESSQYTRQTLWFTSKGTQCEAWFFLPTPRDSSTARPPIVVMAHGIGGQKDMGLSRYARAFAQAGMAVLVFDYRTFGGSDGEPRNWVSPKRHLEDWESAVKFVWQHLNSKVDTDRLALWGTSFAGGHVIVTAATVAKNVSCIVSQIPHLDGRIAMKAARAKRGFALMLKVAFAAVRDIVRRTLNMGRVYIALAAEAPTVAAMTLTNTQLASYYSKHPKEYLGGWQNKIPASILFEIPLYNPIDYVGDVHCPILLLAAGEDTVCPRDALTALQNMTVPTLKFKSWPVDHFKFYGSPVVEEVLTETVGFLKGCLHHP